MTLYLLKYNNYYNRIVKFENSLSAYISSQIGSTLLNINFNPNDGVITEQVINWNDEIPDYLIVSDAENEIVSRWFVIEAVRERKNQYKLSLRRDLIVDFYYDITNPNSVYFIEKANIPDVNSPLIYNSENMLVNQIKKDEFALKDNTGCGWLVGYVSTKSLTENITVSIPAESGLTYPEPSISYDTLISYRNNGVYKNEDGFIVEFVGAVGGTSDQGWALTANVNGDTWARNIPAPDYYSEILFNVGKTDAIRNQTMASISAQVQSNKDSLRTALYAANDANETRIKITDSEYETLLSMNGNTFSDGTNIFTVSTTATGVAVRTQNNITSSAGAAYTLLKDIVDDYSENNPYHPGSGSGIRYEVYVDRLEINVQPANIPSATATITNSAAILKDAPYRMFACPVGTPSTTLDGISYINTLDGNLSKNLCSTIATLLGGTGTSFLYDLQYLPYCPAREFLDENGHVFLGRGTEGQNYTLVKNTDNDAIVQYLLWCKESNFSFVINKTINIPNSLLDFKVAHETEFYRLVSPNYSGSFDFKATSNRGISGFEVNCTYKPYQPYIHVVPVFNENGLYGKDFNDQRGLVCSGDFSVAIVDNAWIDYQITNKAYQDSFNRQVEHMDTSFAISYAQNELAGKLNILTSGIGGLGAGMFLGSSIGGPIGAGVGGLISGGIAMGASSWGLQKDLEYSKALQKETLSYAKDNFNYSLQNIQALPYSLGKVSAFTTNNKIFPFVEFYDCTEEEKKALKNKLKYNGMTVGVIDSITNYIQSEPQFLSAQLIRINLSECDDYHVVAEIASELHRGVYI